MSKVKKYSILVLILILCAVLARFTQEPEPEPVLIPSWLVGLSLEKNTRIFSKTASG